MTVIVDTGIFFAFYSLKDKHHLDSIALIIHLVEGKWGTPYITNHILDETLNILKYRLSPRTAKAFIETFIDRGVVKILYPNEELEKRALKIFKENIDRRGLSYTDALTIATIKEYEINYLLTYDIRSFKGFIDNIIEPNYWNTLTKNEQNKVLKLISTVTKEKKPK